MNTVKVIDELLKLETPHDPAWYRYNEDGYGEHADGSAFDGTGIGRVWPLLTGERAYYELAAGRKGQAEKLLHTFETFANEGGMLSEQVWDSPDIPGKELFFGKPSGSAMPLVWTHAEYVKLKRSLREGRVFDMPPQTVQRYLMEKTGSRYTIWRFNHKCRTIATGKTLRLVTLTSATVHWSDDGWRTVHDTPTKDTGLGVHCADFLTEHLAVDRKVEFTFYWMESGKWENRDFAVTISEA